MASAADAKAPLSTTPSNEYARSAVPTAKIAILLAYVSGVNLILYWINIRKSVLRVRRVNFTILSRKRARIVRKIALNVVMGRPVRGVRRLWMSIRMGNVFLVRQAHTLASTRGRASPVQTTAWSVIMASLAASASIHSNSTRRGRASAAKEINTWTCSL